MKTKLPLFAFLAAYAGTLTLLAFAPAIAHAGEDLLGTIFVTDGGTASNVTTTLPDAGRLLDGGLQSAADGGANPTRWFSAAFPIPAYARLSVQCRDNAHVGVNVESCTPPANSTSRSTCPRVSAEVLFPTSVNTITKNRSVSCIQPNLLADGGVDTQTCTILGGVVSVAPADGGVSAVCDVYTRDGREE